MTTVHFRPNRHLCPDADTRDAMDDGEFWDHVFHGRDAGYPDFPYDPDDDPNAPPPDEVQILTPCVECGALGACAYDVDGRAMVHVTPDEENVDV